MPKNMDNMRLRLLELAVCLTLIIPKGGKVI